VPRAIIEPPKVINLMEALKRSLAPEALVTTMLRKASCGADGPLHRRFVQVRAF
jgi:hypothetical protein